ncbi:MAG: hypothetical protein ACYCY5_12170 [Sulfuricella sp.]
MKLSFWKAGWFLGLLIALAFLFAARSDPLQSLERKAYDLGVHQTRAKFAHDLRACAAYAAKEK